MAKLLAHRDQPIPSLRSASTDVPEQLDAVFHKMVAKKTEDRYQNMTQLIVELQKCHHGDDSTVIGRDVVLPPAEPDMMDFLRDLSVTQATPVRKTQAVTQSLLKQSAGKTPIGNNKRKLLIGGGLLAAIVLLAGIVVSLKTKDGTLVVTVSEADADVQVLNEAGQVEITRKGEKGPITIAVDPGKHRLKVTKDGFEFFTQDFSIESGGKQPITAKLVLLEDQPPAVVTTPSVPTLPPAVMEKPPAVAGVKQPLAFETPGFDQWVKEVSALAPEQQVEAVAKKLVELNPGFDGKVTHQIADGVVTHFKFFTDDVTDVSPVRALAGLWKLDINSHRVNGRFTDLLPLNGLPLTDIGFNNTNVSDLSPLQGMPLIALWCELTHVTDLSPLAGMQLIFFDCYRTPISDIRVLRGMPLKTLQTQLTQVTDYSPLQGMPLDTLVFDVHPLRDTELLRPKHA